MREAGKQERKLEETLVKNPVDVLFGGQFGSEGKGVIIAAIADQYDVHVRVGAPNAGHTFQHNNGNSYKMQTVPVGWCNPNAALIVGRGGLVDPTLLRQEVEVIAAVDPTIYKRLCIDVMCGVLDKHFHESEGGINGEMHLRIGSTGEGVGPAREARISRDPKRFRLYQDLCNTDPWFSQFAINDTPTLIHNLRHQKGARVVLEGAQGQGLSLIHGPWPYCTSTDPGPAQLAADVGIPPTEIGKTIACMRTFPIRVAGTSGPLHDEITWDILSNELGRPIQERTTVTKKIRRVGRWDDMLAIDCYHLHAPTHVALTFVDYLGQQNEGKLDIVDLNGRACELISRIERIMHTKVALISTSPSTVIKLEPFV